MCEFVNYTVDEGCCVSVWLPFITIEGHSVGIRLWRSFYARVVLLNFYTLPAREEERRSLEADWFIRGTVSREFRG